MRITLIAAAFTLVQVTSGGCGSKPKSLEREWKQKTRTDCQDLAELVDELRQDLDRVDHAFRTEIQKTGPKRALYNPGLFGRLGRLVQKLDLTKPRRKERLRRTAWMTHYRFVKDAGKILPRLHRFVALIHQLKASIDLGRSGEQKFGRDLSNRKPGWTPPAKRTRPMFGVIIKDRENAVFTGGLGAPVKRGPDGLCRQSTVNRAQGYKLSDGNCYYFTQPPQKKGDCPKVDGTLRVFDNKDPKLFGALDCLSMADVLMEGFRFRVLDVELILAELGRLNVAGLVKQLRQAGGR
jgi:hypothetical protein